MSRPLIQLINTLTGSEKRYIHLNLKTFHFDEKSNSLLTDFNETDRFIGLKKPEQKLQLKGNATRLYYKLLDILFLLYKDVLYENEHDNRLIKRSQVLFHKGFYEEGVKQLNKVIYTDDSYSYLLRIEGIELKLKAAMKYSDVDYLKVAFEKDKQLLAQYSKLYYNLLQFEGIWALTKVESSTSYFFGKEEKFLEKYDKLLSDEKFALSPAAKIFYNKINGFLAIKKGSHSSALEFALRTKELYDLNPTIRDNNFSEYLRAIRNLCIALTYKKNYHEAEKLLEDADDIINNNPRAKAPHLSADLFTLMTLLRMDLIIHTGKVKEYEFKLQEFEKAVELNEDVLGNDEKITAYLHLMLFYIQTEKYNKAIKIISKALNIPEGNRTDLRPLFIMGKITVYYLQGNDELMVSQLQSYKRLLDKGSYFFEWEQGLVNKLKKISDSPNQPKLFHQLFEFMDSSLASQNQLNYKPYIPVYLLKPH